MKGLVIYAGDQIRHEVKDYGEPLYQTIGQTVGGHIELVRPVGLPDPLLMIVNEEGLLRGLELNLIASILYGILDHGQPIVGNAVIMKQGFVNGEPDIVGLDDADISILRKVADRFRVISEQKQVADMIQFISEQKQYEPFAGDIDEDHV